VAVVPSIPILTASTPMSCATARTCARISSGETASTAVTPTVFCAVMAVTAVMPWTPQAANALRSAWMPAPPPESEPAMDSTHGGRPGRAARGSGRGMCGSDIHPSLCRSHDDRESAARLAADVPVELELRQRGQAIRRIQPRLLKRLRRVKTIGERVE
jgi:hypothetical protein